MADDDHSVSRRTFIQLAIVGGAGVASPDHLFGASTRGEKSGAASDSDRLITLNVNGQPRSVDAMKQETLAWTLRYKLGLTGTKLGCDRGECGACTALIDDVPHYSCSVLTHTTHGKSIVTIEGLASADGTLHPIQQGVLEEQGFQCAHHGRSRIPQNESQSHTVGARARDFRQPLSLSGLRQNSHRAHARRGTHAEN